MVMVTIMKIVMMVMIMVEMWTRTERFSMAKSLSAA
jgi:hypothetical protein